MCNICRFKKAILMSILYLYYSKVIYFNKRIYWVDSYYELRSKYGFDNFLLVNLLKSESVNFFKVFRMNYEQFKFLCQQLDPFISKNQQSFRVDRLSVSEKVAVTLRFLATGDSYVSLELHFHISSSTICKIISEVCNAIIRTIGKNFMKLPTTSQRWLEISDQFSTKWQFPNTLGAMDGKHIGKLNLSSFFDL